MACSSAWPCWSAWWWRIRGLSASACSVGVLVAVGVLVGVFVGVFVAVAVGVLVGVLVGCIASACLSR